jgi:hypothetical protein
MIFLIYSSSLGVIEEADGGVSILFRMYSDSEVNILFIIEKGISGVCPYDDRELLPRNNY